MDWIRTNYDRFAVFVASLFLLLCAIFIWRSSAEFTENFASLPLSFAPRKAGPLPNAVALQDAVQALHQPAQWTFGGRSGLFVPEKHFIGPNGLPVTLQTTEVHPPVPNEWLEQFNLPIADADVLTQDPDGDGFTNLDEWQFHTNPTDKNSHPDYLTKLKMKSFLREPFRMIFASYVGDTFTVNTTDLKEPTQFLKIGDTISGTQFKIMKFEEKRQVNPATGGEADVSELTLEHETTKERITLVKEKTAVSPESVANFVYSWGGMKEFPVRKEQEFSLPPQEGIKYKLVDVQPDKAVIVNTQKPDERIEIGLLTQ